MVAASRAIPPSRRAAPTRDSPSAVQRPHSGYFPTLLKPSGRAYLAGQVLPSVVSPDRRMRLMPFTLPPLAFARDALAPHMSAETIDLHHGKHHQAYIDKTNTLAAEADLAGKTLVEVIRAAPSGPLRNNAAQVWNHSFFWQGLAADPSSPSVRLAGLIDSGFGSTEALLTEFTKVAVAHFASGWAWLVLEHDVLKIVALHDGDTPVLHDGMVPLFTLDVWEHAYYVDYRDARASYVDAVLGNLINWNFVAENLDGHGIARADQG